MNQQELEALKVNTIEKIKQNLHKHFCSDCWILWSHKGSEIVNKQKAHSCPKCGKYIDEISFSRWSPNFEHWNGQDNWEGEEKESL